MKTTQIIILTLLVFSYLASVIPVNDVVGSGNDERGLDGDEGAWVGVGEDYDPCDGRNACGGARSFEDLKEFYDAIRNRLSVVVVQQQIPIPEVTIEQPVFDELPIPYQYELMPTPEAQPSVTSYSDMLPTEQPQYSPPQSPSSSPTPAQIQIPPPTPTPTPTQSTQSTTTTTTPSPQQSPSPQQPHSQTNNQVQNLDQADLLKTDGTYIYTISNSVLSIVLAYPANQATVVGKIDMKGLETRDMVVFGDFLGVFGVVWVRRQYSSGLVSSPETYIKIYDISNRANPNLLKNFSISGLYFSSRLSKSGLLTIITTSQLLPQQSFLPWYNLGTGIQHIEFSSIFWYPDSQDYDLQANNIFVVDLVDGKDGMKGRGKMGGMEGIEKRVKIACVCSGSGNYGFFGMYMAEGALYLVNVDGVRKTFVRKIFVSKKYIRPFAIANVVGTVSNQFFLDEYGQFLRIATTSLQQGVNTNNVFVLDYFLKPYGLLTGIARTESIFSCRYVGKRLYLVTFRQVDPFFVISFRNHRAPQILGQLKVTGFSRYLHPYDETTIIGLGRQADANGRQLGLKISLFDVSDVTHPVESAKFEIESQYASSITEWEHKAFLFSADKHLLVIPGYMDYDGVKFNGAFAFYITKTEVTLRNTIDHLLNPVDNFSERNVERSLWINDLLYTKSKCLLRINKINENFDAVKNINIPCTFI